MKHIVSHLIAFACFVSVAVSAAEPDGAAFFESRIRPVLVMHCYECHSAEKTKGGLRLDYRGGFAKGGKSGALVNASAPDKSLLLQAIRHDSKDLKMPKGADKLPDSVIADLTRWVSMGIPGLSENPPSAQAAATEEWQAKLTKRRVHWAWQPVHKPTVPSLAAHPVDSFLMAKMQEKGLEPAAPAAPAALLRRLKFALVGLPPTEEEMESFVQDMADGSAGKSPTEALIDRLLQSPQFGEHWAAYWLDLMRFGETGGYVRDYPIPQAWRYRDYVIRAFNADVPYDRFVQEHVAGDLLPPRLNAAMKINESPLGTGFMRLMEVSSTASDVALEEAQIVENQIDTLAKAFQGLTVSCARCHDHKFDAISTADYYALFGTLASSRQSQVIIDAPEVKDNGVAAMQSAKQQMKSRLLMLWKDDVKNEAAAMQKWLQNGLGNKPDKTTFWGRVLLREKVDRADPGHLFSRIRQTPPGERLEKAASSWLNEQRRESAAREERNGNKFKTTADFRESDAGWFLSGVQPSTVWSGGSDFTLMPEGKELVDRFVSPGLSSDRLTRKHGSIARSADFSLGTQFVSLRVAGGSSAHVRLIQNNFQQMENIAHANKVRHFDSRFPTWVTVPVGHQASWQGRRSYLEILTKDDAAHFRRSDEGNKPYELVAKDATGRSWFGVDQIVEHQTPGAPENELHLSLRLAPASPEWNAEGLAAHWRKECDAALDRWSRDAAKADDVELLNWLLEHGALRNQLAQLPGDMQKLAEQYRAHESAVPRFQRASAIVAEGTGFDSPVHRRGSPDSPGEKAPRRFLEVIHGAEGYTTGAQARLELAQDLTSPQNPLTARVMANRVWRWIFGQGLVATVDNFGVMGEAPSHPELLDYLATYLVEHDWSVKALIRHLVTSRAFQAQSIASAKAQQVDPANRLLTHMPVQRLRAEAVRDSILAVSGTLDQTMFGYTGPANQSESAAVANPKLRRGVYQYIRREALDHMMIMFDAPEPSRTQGDRETSSVPGQSLLMLNSALVHEQATAWAAKDMKLRKGYSTEQRIEHLFATALGRQPSAQEVQSLVEFIDEQAEAYALPPAARGSDQRLWTDLCHVLINAKEFLYIP
ncbi:PSD1 and planctomycete cytochrome C domain-containing protein [Prosthecobacter sp.]|jgi:cytochrome c553|uniref:PSD1 and planctomycete cytochrome C domain-containing protein n=1 Tax=Prosthecobacter sp. TaxID=1965333 RepID=UPI003784C871